MSKIGYCVIDTKSNTCYVERKEFKNEEEFKKLDRQTILSLKAINGIDSIWNDKKSAEKRCISLNKHYEDWDKYLDESMED